MNVEVIGGTLSQKEINRYVDQLKQEHPDQEIKTVKFIIDGENINADYTFDSKPFHRIRRITGYLVGTLDRFNDAKRAEVNDRVKHSLGNNQSEKI